MQIFRIRVGRNCLTWYRPWSEWHSSTAEAAQSEESSCVDGEDGNEMWLGTPAAREHTVHCASQFLDGPHWSTSSPSPGRQFLIWNRTFRLWIHARMEVYFRWGQFFHFLCPPFPSPLHTPLSGEGNKCWSNTDSQRPVWYATLSTR